MFFIQTVVEPRDQLTKTLWYKYTDTASQSHPTFLVKNTTSVTQTIKSVTNNIHSNCHGSSSFNVLKQVNVGLIE